MSGGSKWKLVYDTTTADGDAVAAFLHATNKLTSTTVGGVEALDVYQRGVFAEDAAHTTADLGQFVLAVRNDTEGSLVGTNGDYAPLQVDALGRLRVNADLNVSNDFVYAEDAAAASGDLAAAILSVRQDTLASSTSADGDYTHIKSTSLGEVYVKDSSANTTLTSILTELQSVTYAEDAAHVSADPGVFMLAVRNDSAATTLTSATGDYSPIAVDSKGRLFSVNSSPNTMTHGSDDSTTTAALLIASAANRREILIQNDGTKAIAVGGATVTYSAAAPNSTDGIIIRAGGEQVLTVGAGADVWTVSQSGTNKVRFMQLAD